MYIYIYILYTYVSLSLSIYIYIYAQSLCGLPHRLRRAVADAVVILRDLGDDDLLHMRLGSFRLSFCCFIVFLLYLSFANLILCLVCLVFLNISSYLMRLGSGRKRSEDNLCTSTSRKRSPRLQV